MLRQWTKGLSLQKKIMTVVLGNMVVILFSMVLFMQATVYRNMQKETISGNGERLVQIDRNISLILNQIAEDTLDIYSDIQKKIGVSKDILNNHRAFSIYFAQYYPMLIKAMRSYRYIHSMMLFTKDGEEYYQSTNVAGNFLQEDLYAKTLEMADPNKIITWSTELGENFYLDTDSNKKIVSEILEIKINYKTEALFVVNIYAEELENFIENAQENEYLVLQLNQNNMISSVQDTSRFTQEDLYQLLESIDRDNFVNTSDYYIFTEKIETTDWELSLIYPKRQINKNRFESISSVLILIFVFGIGMFCINLVIVKEVTNPINRVTKDIIQTVETGKMMPVSFTPKSNDEVSSLVSCYNKLIEKVQDDCERIEKEQHLRNAMYLQMLQMQINPHFLYNTLETLKCLIIMQDEKAEEMAGAIGDFYKGALIDGDDVTRMGDEIYHVQSYLKIMKLRYRKKMDYKINVSDELMNNIALKLSLQPVVENAIIHGIQQKHGLGYIEINVYRKNRKVQIEIVDNGTGIKEEYLKSLQNALSEISEKEKNSHIGLVNVNNRIQLRFGDEYGIQIDSVEGEYTRVILIIPDSNYYTV